MREMIGNFWLNETETPGVMRLGFTPEFAESVPGDWVSLDLPKAGDVFEPEEGFAFLTTHRATIDLRAPVPMRITQTNDRVRTNPGIIRLSPTHEGWIVEFENPDATATA